MHDLSYLQNNPGPIQRPCLARCSSQTWNIQSNMSLILSQIYASAWGKYYISYVYSEFTQTNNTKSAQRLYLFFFEKTWLFRGNCWWQRKLDSLWIASLHFVVFLLVGFRYVLQYFHLFRVIIKPILKINIAKQNINQSARYQQFKLLNNYNWLLNHFNLILL